MEPFNFFEEGRGGGGIVTKGEARWRGGGRPTLTPIVYGVVAWDATASIPSWLLEEYEGSVERRVPSSNFLHVVHVV